MSQCSAACGTGRTISRTAQLPETVAHTLVQQDNGAEIQNDEQDGLDGDGIAVLPSR